MPKLIFRAEIPLPRSVVLPLAVAREADSPRTIVITDQEMDVAKPIAEHLQTKHPSWFEKLGKGSKAADNPDVDDKADKGKGSKTASKSEDAPSDKAEGKADQTDG